MSQIDQLRKQFNGYDNAQKKQFIDNLKMKLQGKNNPEYTKFLNECISSYNASLRGSSLSTNSSLSNNDSDYTFKCSSCGAEIMPNQKTCFTCFKPIQRNSVTGKVAMGLGIGGIVIFPLAIPLAIVAIILGIVNSKAKYANVGIILGIIGLAIGIFITFLLPLIFYI
jgi:hypothetical protein